MSRGISQTARREIRGATLRRLGYPSYAVYLQSGRWHDVRRRYFESDRPQDCICGKTEGLQIHHLTYERIGAERLDDLTPLCKACHAMIHVLERRGEIRLDFSGFVDARRVERYEREQRGVDRGIEIAQAELERRIRATAKSVGLHIREACVELVRRGEHIEGFLDEVKAVTIEAQRAHQIRQRKPATS